MPDPMIPAEFIDFLRRSGLIGPSETATGTPLTGGVSSDIWKIDRPGGAICVKRALGKLKVAGEWYAPIERNAYEVAWMKTAAAIDPQCAPQVLAHDPQAGMFAMPYLSPDTNRLWKAELLEGRADIKFAAACGAALARIHRETMDKPDIAAAFATDDIFHAIRLEPYLTATASRHPDMAERLTELVNVTAATKQALVHGDISPKNILVTASGPVFLDAECAWYGDPAFDLAFCLNHFLLKCLHRHQDTPAYLACFDAMERAYGDHIDAAAGPDIAQRTAHLLPGLFLARVDGKSPVEYLSNDADKDRVRRTARKLLRNPVDQLAGVRKAWANELGT